MWRRKGKWLGTLSRSGEPQLFEQFMLNVIDDGLARVVLPVRIASIVGLQYAFELIAEGKTPRPSIIYVDAAHQYPETLREVVAA
eukprot:969538-Prymnesium_polylepis.2